MAHKNLVLVLVDMRSTYNVGSCLRTCDGFGASACFVGITPLPAHKGDTRLPHLARKNHEAIAKTALGAEETVYFEQYKSLNACVQKLREEGFYIVALEQSKDSQPIQKLQKMTKIAIVVGREVEGLTDTELSCCDRIYEIPMVGEKESFNVAIAAGIALYQAAFAKRKSLW